MGSSAGSAIALCSSSISSALPRQSRRYRDDQLIATCTRPRSRQVELASCTHEQRARSCSAARRCPKRAPVDRLTIVTRSNRSIQRVEQAVDRGVVVERGVGDAHRRATSPRRTSSPRMYSRDRVIGSRLVRACAASASSSARGRAVQLNAASSTSVRRRMQCAIVLR